MCAGGMVALKRLLRRSPVTLPLKIDQARIASFCSKWAITELSLFGSILRDDFGPDSDVDVLISFNPDAAWTLFDLVDMKEELEEIFERQVDLLTRAGIESSRNYIRREAILSNAEVAYAT